MRRAVGSQALRHTAGVTLRQGACAREGPGCTAGRSRGRAQGAGPGRGARDPLEVGRRSQCGRGTQRGRNPQGVDGVAAMVDGAAGMGLDDGAGFKGAVFR